LLRRRQVLRPLCVHCSSLSSTNHLLDTRARSTFRLLCLLDSPPGIFLTRSPGRRTVGAPLPLSNMPTMAKAWMSSLAVGAALAVAPLKPVAAQNPNNELFLQSFISGSVESILTKIFVPNVTFAAGTGFDIR